MKNAAVILGVLGGTIGMITGFFVYGWVAFVDWFGTEVDPGLIDSPENALRLQIIGVVAPVLAIAGGAMCHPRPAIGALLLALSLVGMIWAFGVGVFTVFPIAMTGLATLFAILGLATREPGTL